MIERQLRKLCDLWVVGVIGDAEFCEEAMRLLVERKKEITHNE